MATSGLFSFESPESVQRRIDMQQRDRQLQDAAIAISGSLDQQIARNAFMGASRLASGIGQAVLGQVEQQNPEVAQAVMRANVLSQAQQVLKEAGVGLDDPRAFQAIGKIALDSGDFELADMAAQRFRALSEPFVRAELEQRRLQAQTEGAVEVAKTKAQLEREERQTKLQEKKLEKDLRAEDTRFSRAAKLRSEINQGSKLFNEVSESFARIQASANDPSAAGDLALIFSFMKVLDPGSVVREGEFANAENAGGVGERIRSQYNKVRAGQRLSEAQRADFLNQAQALFSAAQKTNQKRVDKILSIGKRFGVPEEDIIGQAAPTDPQIKFLGF